MDISDDVAQILLEEFKVIFRWTLLSWRHDSIRTWGRVGCSLIQARNDLVDFLFTGFDAANNLTGLYSLEAKDLVELALQFCNKRLLIIFAPWAARRARLLSTWCTLIRGFESRLEVIVGNVVVIVVFQKRGTQLLTEARKAVSVALYFSLYLSAARSTGRGRTEFSILHRLVLSTSFSVLSSLSLS